MLRGNRLLIAAVGLALACANHAYAEGSKQQPQAEQSVAKSLSDIASANNQQAERAKRSDQDEAPCGQGQYGSSADLCAQWKAADAAADSAWWAWVAAISTIVSTAAVLIAIALTFQANAIARDTAKRELRAYVFPFALEFEWKVSLNEGTRFAEIKTVLRNAGQSPTRGMRLAFSSAYEFIPRSQFDTIKKSGQVTLLGPGDDVRTNSVIIPADDVIEIFKLQKSLHVFGGVFYDDVFGHSRETRFCFKVRFHRIGEDDFPNHITWQYEGPHNCSDEECEEQRKALTTHHESPADVTEK